MTKQVWTEKHYALWNKTGLWIILQYKYAGCRTCMNHRHSRNYFPHCLHRGTKSKTNPIGYIFYTWPNKGKTKLTMSTWKPRRKNYDVDYICTEFFKK